MEVIIADGSGWLPIPLDGLFPLMASHYSIWLHMAHMAKYNYDLSMWVYMAHMALCCQCGLM